MRFPELYTFSMDVNLKDQAVKVLEEASEVLEAVKEGDKRHIQEEIMDTVQALANLCKRLGYTELDMGVAYRKVFMKNKSKGRYED